MQISKDDKPCSSSRKKNATSGAVFSYFLEAGITKFPVIIFPSAIWLSGYVMSSVLCQWIHQRIIISNGSMDVELGTDVGKTQSDVK